MIQNLVHMPADELVCYLLTYNINVTHMLMVIHAQLISKPLLIGYTDR